LKLNALGATKLGDEYSDTHMTEKWKIAYKRFSDRVNGIMPLTTETAQRAHKHHLKAKLNLAMLNVTLTWKDGRTENTVLSDHQVLTLLWDVNYSDIITIKITRI